MASAWGKSWGRAFGAVFGQLLEVVPEPQTYAQPLNAFGGHPVRDWVQVPKRRLRKSRKDEILFLTH